jgi:hypothetical protein
MVNAMAGDLISWNCKIWSFCRDYLNKLTKLQFKAGHKKEHLNRERLVYNGFYLDDSILSKYFLIASGLPEMVASRS